MSYFVTIVNSTDAPMTTKDGQTIAAGDTWRSGVNGNTYVHSEEFGSVSFRDIADQHIGGDTDETWGVLISYNGQHMVGRYEGGGELHVTFNNRLQAELSGMNLRRVRLDSLVSDHDKLLAGTVRDAPDAPDAPTESRPETS
ncbi:MAG TPA: hypothetical protein VF517_07885 [Thermoleophilaceae bacterium]